MQRLDAQPLENERHVKWNDVVHLASLLESFGLKLNPTSS
jgi:hypothetical protein